MSWKRYGWVGFALLGAAGCGGESITDYQPVQMKAKLESFESCESLEKYIEDTAVRQMRTSMERSKPSRDQGGWFGTPRLETDGGAPTSGGMDPYSGPKDHTGTNNQVEGVDEADFVKNDGTRLFVLSGNKLYVQRSWPADALRVESSLELEGWPRAMFLEGDRVVIFSGVYGTQQQQQQRGGVSTADVACAPFGPCGYGYGPVHTKVTTVDVADLSAPRVTGELSLPGDYHDARMAGG
ncbi:MAG TPA: beta-propeller domain-containing protein, partial [Myxococcaceae bacterium]|nr:beta-propeller domain-containing protein [Myxococcaceae bacterium]